MSLVAPTRVAGPQREIRSWLVDKDVLLGDG